MNEQMRNLLLRREDFWILKLGTLYPGGFNDKLNFPAENTHTSQALWSPGTLRSGTRTVEVSEAGPRRHWTNLYNSFHRLTRRPERLKDT